jgi:Cd2+/Zn2+-exporting ATPase
MANKKNYKIQNIDCPGCASNIETEIAKVDGVLSASVDFVSGRLMLDLETGTDADAVFGVVRQTVKRLEPDVEIVEPSQSASSKPQAKLKKSILSLAVGVALYACAYASLLTGQAKVLTVTLFLLSFLVAGLSVVIKAVRNILGGRMFDESLLMTVATVGAFAIGKFEEGAAVMLFYGAGELMENLASIRSVKSIEAAMDLRPDMVNLVTDDGVKQVSPNDVEVGDIFEVRPGEKFPIDGTVTAGESFVDTKALTGEPVPRRAVAGGEVLAGYVNQSGLLTVRADRVYEASSAAKTLELIRQADGKKARSERFITRFAHYYTPAVTLAALLTAVLPPLILSQPFSLWIYRALTFLVVSCPCALVISVPLSVFAGIGAASKAGILIKGGSSLESLAGVDTVLLDKTGTLTQGVFEVVKTLTANGVSAQRLTSAAAAAEAGSNHPIALSIAKAAGVGNQQAQYDFSEVPGRGVMAKSGDRVILAGNEALMSANGIKIERCAENGTLVYIAENGEYLGCIVVADVIKAGAAKTVKALTALGVSRLVMVTGDNAAAASGVAEKLGITDVHAGLLPEQKAAVLEQYEGNAKGTVLFVGDGINDAPVIAGADVGVAMGGIGSDVAVEAADAVIMDDDPSRLADAVVIARHTKAVITQNIIFALTVKFAVLALTALGLATMWEAVFADVGVALIAILNAMRILLTGAKGRKSGKAAES